MKNVFLLFFCFAFVTAFSQTKNSKPAPATAVQRLPKLGVTIGGLKSGEITQDVLSRIVDSALVAYDEKGNTYSIVRFRVLYKFKSSFEDPESGERKTTDDMRVNDFTNTNVMPDLWKESLKENIHKGDEMIVDNIIVRLKNGAKLMAPLLTFKII